MINFNHREKKNNKRRQTLLLILSLAVVFFTVYMLILPAVAVDKESAELMSGLELETVAKDDAELVAGLRPGMVTEGDAESEENVGFETIASDADESEQIKEATREAKHNEESRQDEESVQSEASDIDTTTERISEQKEDPVSGETANKETVQSKEDASENPPSLIDKDTELRCEGEDFIFTAEVDKDAKLPVDSSLDVKEIAEGTKKYDRYYDQAMKTMVSSDKSTDSVEFVRIFDVSINSDGDEVEPEDKLVMKVEFDKEAGLPDDFGKNGDISVVWLPVNGDKAAESDKLAESYKPELIEDKNITTDDNSVSFKTDKTDVFVVVYTVDFHYVSNGNTYDLSIPGGSFIKLTDILKQVRTVGENERAGAASGKSEETGEVEASIETEATGEVEASIEAEATGEVERSKEDESTEVSNKSGNSGKSENANKSGNEGESLEAISAKDIAGASFSDLSLVWIGKAEKDTTIGELKASNSLNVLHSGEIDDAEVEKIDETPIEAGEWVLISLQPFDTEETLSVSLSNGKTIDIIVTDARSTGVTYSISTDKNTDTSGTELNLNIHAEVQPDLSSYLFPTRYVYILMDQSNAHCEELKGASSGETVTVSDRSGENVTLHLTDDGFWFELNAGDGETVDIPLHFNSEEVLDESENQRINIYAGAGISVAGGFGLSARDDALGNLNRSRYGWAEPNTYVNLSWTKEEVDPEPVWDDEFSVSADQIYGYFNTELDADFHAQAGRGSENNVFYVRQSADRAELKVLADARLGDIAPAVDNEGNPITDRYGTQLMFHVTDDGFWFELDNLKHNNFADFKLPYKASDDASQNVSNAAKMRLYLAQGSNQDTAEAAAKDKFSPNLSLTWSDTGDKLQYQVNLIWDTSVEEDKYDQNVVTTSQSILQPKYVLDLLTSSANYEAEQFRIELPYAMWAYRNSKNGTSCSIPTDISIPKEGEALNGSLFHYHIEYDETNPKDLTKAKLVITNAAYLPAGTNARITTKYSVDPWLSVDLSTSEITAMITAQATNQTSPELGESNTITYRLDTGFDKCYLNKTSTWTSTEAAAVYSKPDNLADDYWDPDNYNMVRFHINYGASSYNQPLDLDFLATLPEGAELVMVKAHTGTRPITINSEDGTWERTITSKSLSSSDGDYWFYVRFPRTGDGDADYHVRLDMDVTAHDDDSHTPPEDYNDTGHQYLEWDFHWKDYEFKPTGSETYSKAGWGDEYIEAVKAGNTDIEFYWRMYVTTNRWYLDDGETQYIQLTDDAHFWKYVPSTYGTNDWRNAKDMHWMSDDSWEFSRITSIGFQYSDLSHRNGSTIYPDFEGGSMVVQASKDGVTWDTIEIIEVPASTDRNSAYITVPNSGKYTFDKGSGYTRLRVISPEVGRGSLHVDVDFYTRMKGDSDLVKKWLDECSDDQKVYVRNYAAYQHFTRSYETVTEIDPETGETATKKTDKLGDYVWDDRLTNPYSYAVSDGSSDGQTLAARDVIDKQYYDGEADGYIKRAYANGQLRHFTYSAQIKKSTGETINDTANQRAIVPFSIFEEEIVSGKSGDQYTEIYKEFSQDSGVFYDLLPPGYKYLEGSVDGQTAAGLDAPVTVETIDDFRRSGRQMVIFKLTKPADPEDYTTATDTNLKNQGYQGYIFGKTKDTQYKSNYTGNPHTGFRIDFQTYIPWKQLVDHPSEVNLVSFQRTDGQKIRAGASDQGYPNREKNFPSSDSQLIKEFKGTAASSRKIDYDKSSTEAFDDAFKSAGGVRGSGPGIFTDVDGDGVITDKSSLYAYSSTNPQVVDGVQTGIIKEVMGDEGKAAVSEGEDGWNSFDRTTLNGSYSYKITAYASMGQMYGLIIYDTLEDAQNKEGASGETVWKGNFESVDISEARKLGFDPVVYYSTASGLDYNSITGNEEVIWIEDSSVWSTECPDDRSTVTAIAVDLRKMEGGTDAVIRSKAGEDDTEPDRVSVIVNMTAPDSYPKQGAYCAINRPAYSCYQKGFFSAEEMHKSDIGLRVKIYLSAELRIRKTSIGKTTPDTAKFTLTFPNGYKYSFTYAEFDNNGEFVLNEEKLEAIRKVASDPSKVPDYVETGTYTVTEDAESAEVDDIVPEVTYNGSETCTFVLAGKTDSDDAPEDKQNIIRIVNDYGTEDVTLGIVKVDTDNMTTPLKGAEFTLTAIDPEATSVSELKGPEANSGNSGADADPENAETKADPENAETKANLENVETKANSENAGAGADPENAETKANPENAETKANSENAKTKANPENAAAESYSEKRTSGDDGRLAFEELSEGCYVLSETAVPAGYVLTEDNTIYLKIKNGEIILLKPTDGKKVKDWDEKELEADGSILFNIDSQTLTIGNTKGAALPSTGGAGRRGFYITGIILVLISALAAAMRRKV